MDVLEVEEVLLRHNEKRIKCSGKSWSCYRLCDRTAESAVLKKKSCLQELKFRWISCKQLFCMKGEKLVRIIRPALADSEIARLLIPEVCLLF